MHRKEPLCVCVCVCVCVRVCVPQTVSSVLMVSDLVTTFHKALPHPIKPLAASDLAAWIVAVAATPAADDTAAAAAAAAPAPAVARSDAGTCLASLYSALLRCVLGDTAGDGGGSGGGGGGSPGEQAGWRQDTRWLSVLRASGSGCWSEVVRRIMMSRATGESCTHTHTHTHTHAHGRKHGRKRFLAYIWDHDLCTLHHFNLQRACSHEGLTLCAHVCACVCICVCVMQCVWRATIYQSLTLV